MTTIVISSTGFARTLAHVVNGGRDQNLEKYITAETMKELEYLFKK